MAHWINYTGKKECEIYADQVIGIGYIPWSPAMGRHIMDDYGELKQALPQDHYLDERDNYMWEFFKDSQYSYH